MVAIRNISSLLLSAGIVVSLTTTTLGQQQSSTTAPVEGPPRGSGGGGGGNDGSGGGPPNTEGGGGSWNSPSPMSAPGSIATPSPTIASMSTMETPTNDASTTSAPLSSFQLPRTDAPGAPALPPPGAGNPTFDPSPSPTMPAKFVGAPSAVDVGMAEGNGGAPLFDFDLPRTGAPTAAPTGNFHDYGAPSAGVGATFSPTFDGSSWMSGSDAHKSGAPTSSPTPAEYMEAVTSSPTASGGDGMVVRMLLQSMFKSAPQASPSTIAEDSRAQGAHDQVEASSAHSAHAGVEYDIPANVYGAPGDVRSRSKAKRALRGAP